jgi:hypothetical protein
VSLPRLQTDVEAEAATAVGRTYRFRPVQMNTAGPVNQRLQNLILKPPTPGTPPEVTTLRRMFGPVSKSLTASDGGLDISPSNLMRDAQHYGWTGNGPGGDSCVFLG